MKIFNKAGREFNKWLDKFNEWKDKKLDGWRDTEILICSYILLGFIFAAGFFVLLNWEAL